MHWKKNKKVCAKCVKIVQKYPKIRKMRCAVTSRTISGEGALGHKPRHHCRRHKLAKRLQPTLHLQERLLEVVCGTESKRDVTRRGFLKHPGTAGGPIKGAGGGVR